MNDKTKATLSPRQWERVESLFEAAVQLTQEEVGPFLNESCGDDITLRKEIEALLIADGREDKFLAPLESDLPTTECTVTPEQLVTGTRLGAYEIVDMLATGGMGKVYLARRVDHQYEKRVAIKVIKRGTDTDEVLRRFRHERQTLADLDHPGIAKMLDGGMTDDGLPYIVMEYIEGEPIDLYCDRNKLTIEQRLGLFREVCSAVQYAHQNLVIHRDIKPANIMVDQDGSPKLLDFGIAKVLDPNQSGSEFVTLEGKRLMTPEYASPEQVRGEAVGTLSDVYSLGVVLYELLTGRRPYHFGTRFPAEIRRVVCETPPDPPSTVVIKYSDGQDQNDQSVTAHPKEASRVGNGDVRRLQRVLTGDIDTIVLKALRKEPVRRYASVQQFSEDIERHQHGLPITARKDTWNYRAGKFIKRHRALTAVSAVLALVLVVGATAVAVVARKAIVERDAANVARQRADREADRSKIESQKARQISDFVQSMLASVHPEREGIDVTVREVLDLAANQIEDALDGQPEVEAEVRTTIGLAYQGLGVYDKSEEHLRAALKLRQTHSNDAAMIAQSMNHLAAVLAAQGAYTESIDLSAEALELVDSHDVNSPENKASILENIAFVLRRQGDWEQSEQQYRRALELRKNAQGADHIETATTMTYLAALISDQGQYEPAEELFRNAIDIKRSVLDKNDPRLASDLSEFSGLLGEMNKLSEAETVVREAVSIRRAALGDDHPSLATSLAELSLLLRRQGEFDEALRIAQEVLTINRKALKSDHPDLAGSMNDLAGLLRRKGEVDEAEALYHEALDVVQNKFGRAHPLVAAALHNLGRLHHGQRNRDRAEAFYLESLEIKREVLGPDHPDLAKTLNNLGALYQNQKNYAAAKGVHEQTLRIRRKSLPPNHPNIGGSLYDLANTLLRLDQPEQALPYIRECIKTWKSIETPDPISIAMANGLHGECMSSLGKIDEATRLLMESYEQLKNHKGISSRYTQVAVRRLVAFHEANGSSGDAQRFKDMLVTAD